MVHFSRPCMCAREAISSLKNYDHKSIFSTRERDEERGREEHEARASDRNERRKANLSASECQSTRGKRMNIGEGQH